MADPSFVALLNYKLCENYEVFGEGMMKKVFIIIILY